MNLSKLLPVKNALKRKPDVVQSTPAVSRKKHRLSATMWLTVNGTRHGGGMSI